MTLGELVYIVLDELKSSSDDRFFNERHVIFTLNKYRPLLIYEKIKRDLLESEGFMDLVKSSGQLLCLDLIEVPAIPGELCEGGTFLRSKDKIPKIITSFPTEKITEVMPIDWTSYLITVVHRSRFKFVGENRWLRNIIYATIAPDGYLYLKSFNPQYLMLEKVKLFSIFNDPETALSLLCDDDGSKVQCDLLDMEYPIDAILIPQLIELTVKELVASVYLPRDEDNNAKDDLPDIQDKYEKGRYRASQYG